ncbi:transcriptional regulatory protein zraR [Candidatus Methylomirabilis lanthanidiphila]|uniref:Transcriptional regulatory protein zraR n=1 Tax=Candidatus Methylomirabilis lanthanidiphila TaxID=2211376 RepID=A0A564ZF51_9BACT|nr:sigma-54 dependent transcriptional regulator [Candidatus Methylomirabilis lanthanidiphila]VUZ83894.1 transcriptional regulatory protein zraR [Candidatus Methylomirabilis lanthanidiphila]
MKMPRILIVEDNSHMLAFLNATLERHGFIPVLTSDCEHALRTIALAPVDLAILDYRLPGQTSGLDLARLIKQRDARLPIILITAHSTENLTIETQEARIDDYFPKPLAIKDLLVSIQRLLASRGLCTRPASAGTGGSVPGLIDAHRLVGSAAPMQEIKAYIRKVAQTDSNVLITGETGTGKELVAELIHKNSKRAGKPFICLNCAAIPESLTESELFGYERGAFTGAYAAYEGKLKQADGGTVLLDEIGDMPLSAQAKVLRLLDKKTAQRVGGRRDVAIDLRVIAATNQDLDALMAAGTFRRDLYYRLNVAHISLPPLRARRKDIPLLLRHFICEFNTRRTKQVRGIASELVERLLQYDWPGNVRELRNMIEVCLIDLDTHLIDFTHIPEQYRVKLPGCGINEKEAILSALLSTRWNKSQAAQKLHWSRMTLYRKLTKHHIVSSRSETEHDTPVLSDTEVSHPLLDVTPV